MKLALLVIMFFGMSSVELSPQENRHLDNLVHENFVLECEAIDTANFSNVIEASFIGVKEFHLFEKNCNSKADCGHFSHKVLKSGDTIVELTGSDVLLPYIAPSFQLKSEFEANKFEEMLDVVFPVFFSSGTEVYQEGNTWVFIREDSFGEKNGVVVNVDDAGVILSIADEMAIERNDLAGENQEVGK